MNKMNKIFWLSLLFVSILVAKDTKHEGFWVYENSFDNFMIEAYFNVALHHWQFEYTAYMVNLEGEKTNIVVVEKYMSGNFIELTGEFKNFIICKVDKKYVDNKPIEIDEDIVYSFRMITDSTAAFGRVKNNMSYELFNFKKKEF